MVATSLHAASVHVVATEVEAYPHFLLAAVNTLQTAYLRAAVAPNVVIDAQLVESTTEQVESPA